MGLKLIGRGKVVRSKQHFLILMKKIHCSHIMWFAVTGVKTSSILGNQSCFFHLEFRFLRCQGGSVQMHTMLPRDVMRLI